MDLLYVVLFSATNKELWFGVFVSMSKIALLFLMFISVEGI